MFNYGVINFSHTDVVSRILVAMKSAEFKEQSQLKNLDAKLVLVVLVFLWIIANFYDCFL